ncbi:MAG: hypothetical protein GY711_06000 [bacterium]|nr:hypothetical protein [bacterium]
MVRRSKVRLESVADLDHLAWAFWRVTRGKRRRSDVLAMSARLEYELDTLRAGILEHRVPLGSFHRFPVHDPKRRTIHAPALRERVVHMALMARIGPELDRSLVEDTFACLPGRGPLAAIRRAQHFVRRFPWYVKADVRRYFDSVDHGLLMSALKRRLKDGGILRLCERIVDCYQVTRGRGLPIGAVTSQHFANLYLAPLDRYLYEELKVRGMVRYMDDIVWWCKDRDQARATRDLVQRFVAERLCLRFGAIRTQRSAAGLGFCGAHIGAGAIGLSRRRRTRYAAARRRWERAYASGRIDALGLQRAYGPALAMTLHADAAAWRREQLRTHPAPC